MVNPATGGIDIVGDDVHGGGFGAWGHRRVWSNQTKKETGQQGSGWSVDQLPQITQAPWGVIVQSGGERAFSFTVNAGIYTPVYHNAERLKTMPGDELQFEDTMGNITVFHAFTAAVPFILQGKMKRFIDAGGTMTTLTYANGQVQRAEQIGSGGTGQATIYTYVASGVNMGLTATVSLEVTTASVATIVRQTAYDYYTGAVGEFGNVGTLARCTIKDGAGTPIESTLYRYYRGEAGGQNGFLKYVVQGRQYDRLKATVADPLTATEAEVAPYADMILGYDSLGRVSTKQQLGAGCTCSGSTGQGRFVYTYATSAFADNYNAWKTQCTELLPDGTDADDTDNDRNITFSNYAGQPMIRVRQQGSTGLKWITYYRYDTQGRVVLMANPSAVTGYDETKADLVNVVTNNAQYLADAAGLFEVTVYGASTTATAVAAGNVAGYVQSRSQRIGELGIDIPIGAQTYWLHTDVNGVAIYPVASTTVYRNTDGTGAQTTNISYTWQGTTNQIASRTVTPPIVPTAQNGSNVAVTRTEVFDQFGRTIWEKDEAGFLVYTEYDQATGAVTKSIRDVNTALTGDFANLPSGWATPVGGGLHIKSLCRVDLLGRCTKETDPVGNITYTVYRDPQFEVRTYPGWLVSNVTTGPTVLVREDRVRNYRERLTMSTVPALNGSEPAGTEAVASLRSLERELLDNGGRVLSNDIYKIAPTYSQNSPLGTLNTDYYRTDYFYDKRGRKARVQDGMGTITRLEYDALDRLNSQWTGTNDTVAVGFWSPTNNTAPSNMVQVLGQHYDFDAVGDSNLTSSAAIVNATTNYTTQFRYDGRNRQTLSRGPDGVATLRTLNNRNQATQIDTFADANADLALGGSELRGRSQDLFDETGNVFDQRILKVDPITGQLFSNYLQTLYWYDPRGLMAKTRGPNGQLSKTVYDGARRTKSSYLSIDSGGDSLYADALTLVNDKVIEQQQIIYNANSDVVAVTSFKRNDNDTTSTGALAANACFLQVAVKWYDAARRQLAECNYGRDNGVTRYVWNTSGTLIDANANGLPDEAEAVPRSPNTSDDYIVTKYVYDTTGRPYQVYDNLNRITEREYDFASQVTKVIEARANAVAEEIETTADRITEYIYGPGWQLTTLRAYNPKGLGQGVEQQNTTYLYGSPYNKGWPTNIIYPDSTDTTSGGTDQVKFLYDPLGRKIRCEDQNGTVKNYLYENAAGQLSAEIVTTVGAGVSAAVRSIIIEYDDLGRRKKVTSGSSPGPGGGTPVNQVEFIYGPWGTITKVSEAHSGAVAANGTTPSVQYAYVDSGASNAQYVRLNTLTFPNGTVQYYYYGDPPNVIGKALNRVDKISAASNGGSAFIHYSDYIGASTIVRTQHPSVTGGLQMDYGVGATYTGFDRFGRIIDQKWKTDAGAFPDRFQYTYDRGSRKLTRDMTWTGAPTNKDESYLYDNLDRLTRFNRGTLVSGAIADAASTYNQDWTPDELGNWRSFRLDADGLANSWTAQARVHNKVNEIDTDDIDSNAAGASISGTMNWFDPVYDKAGNLKTGPIPGNETSSQAYVWDAWNRLVAVTGKATYTYDGLGRRITRFVNSTGKTTHFYYGNGWQELETRTNTATTATEQYVWDDRYIDAPVLRRRDSDGNGTIDETLYYTKDAQFNVTALITTAGVVVERYAYDPYGKRMIYAADGVTVRATSSYANAYGFTGRYHDTESGLVYFRNRYMDPSLGRFIGRDPLGYVDGGSLYNAYFVPNGVDPYGERWVYVNGYKIWVTAEEDEIPWYKGGYWAEREVAQAMNDYADQERRMEAAKAESERAKDVGMLRAGIEQKPFGPVFLEAVDCQAQKGNIKTAAVIITAGVALVVTMEVASSRCAAKCDPRAAKSGTPALDDLSRAAGDASKGGFTKAGSSLQSHSPRPGSKWNQTDINTNNPKQANPRAQDLVDDALTTPGSTVTPSGRGGWDVTTPDGRVIRYNRDGTFQGFRE